MQLQPYSRLIVGEYKFTTQIVCDDGVIRMVRIEEYIDGLHFFVKKDDGDYTNHRGYKRSISAIQAAARLA